MNAESRHEVTLVQVVVLVVVIGFFLALLVAYLGQSRDPSRRASCMNNQKNFSLALLQYEGTNARFPGYKDRIGKDAMDQPVVASWFVVIAPYLERSDIFRKWEGGDTSETPYMAIAVCPSNPNNHGTRKGPLLDYVVNCGLPGDDDTLADGVFFNHDVDTRPLMSSVDEISRHDGTATTLLLSENIQAGNWNDTAEADLGMVWFERPGKCAGINECLDVGDAPGKIEYARPSSYHGSGVVVSFCDGHQHFLSEKIHYNVYRHLMTPDSAAAGVNGELTELDY